MGRFENPEPTRKEGTFAEANTVSSAFRRDENSQLQPEVEPQFSHL